MLEPIQDLKSPLDCLPQDLSMGSAVKDVSCLELPWELEMAI